VTTDPALRNGTVLLRSIRWISLIGTAVTLGALAAHVLELPNKRALDGPLWLAVQQQLYRGWGPFIGPFEVAAVVFTWILLWPVRRKQPIRRLTLAAAILLSLALAAFFALNAPVNAAFASWTPATMPANWPDYRLRWEAGHAISFVLVLISLILLLRALFIETSYRGRQRL
jgi:hypothetical protein